MKLLLIGWGLFNVLFVLAAIVAAWWRGEWRRDSVTGHSVVIEPRIAERQRRMA